MKAIRSIAAAIIAAGVAIAAPAAAQDIDALLKTIKLPPGFKISLFARVPSARSLSVDPVSGAIFVGSRSRAVHRIIDRDGDGFADEVARVTGALRVPNGLAIRGGKLFIAEQHRISFWAGTDDGGAPRALDPLTTIFAGLPDKSWHGWRYAGFGPDGKLYVSLGSPCNVCAPEGLEGSIIRIRPEGGAIEVVAHGVRNSVGFDWHPTTGELFFTDNGADRMGDDEPADELNHVTSAGQFSAFPISAAAAPGRRKLKARLCPQAPRLRPSNFRPTSPVSACIFIAAISFRVNIRAMRSSPSTAPGTAPARWVTASCVSASMQRARPPANRFSPLAGCRGPMPGVGRWISK
jgi:glucose/arabinose dehydrogenase